MLYNLLDGRTIEITIEQFLSMSDDELNSLTSEYGDTINDPFYDSVIRGKKYREDVSPEEKFNDLDLDIPEE